MKYITYKTNYNGKQLLIPGGMGHSLTDYLSSYIVSKLYPDVKFLHNKLRFYVEIQKGMGFNTDLEEDPYLWNDFLNLDYFDKKIDQNNIDHKFICFSNDFMPIDLKNLDNTFNENFDDDIIYCLTNNNRIYLLDLYYYEKNNLVRNNITKEIIDDFRDAFYSKHTKIINKKKKINVYIRRGDLYYINKNGKNIVDDNFYNFEFLVFNYIYNILKNEIENENKYEINIISAGSKDEMEEIKQQFSIFKNIKLWLNEGQFPVFTLLTQSDLLIYSTSSFPFIASLYTDALVIYRENDYYFKTVTHIKKFSFFDNYIFIDTVSELENNTKFMDYLKNYFNEKIEIIEDNIKD